MLGSMEPDVDTRLISPLRWLVIAIAEYIIHSARAAHGAAGQSLGTIEMRLKDLRDVGKSREV